MARYIDAEDLKAVIKANDWSNPVVPDVVGIIIDRTPTADVVPKSAVDKAEAEIERLWTILDSYALQYGTVMDKHIVIEKARAEVTREIFEEIEKHRDKIHGIALLLPEELAELKKKYTEG